MEHYGNVLFYNFNIISDSTRDFFSHHYRWPFKSESAFFYTYISDFCWMQLQCAKITFIKLLGLFVCLVWIEKSSFSLDPEARNFNGRWWSTVCTGGIQPLWSIAAATLQQITCTNTSAIKAQKPGERTCKLHQNDLGLLTMVMNQTPPTDRTIPGLSSQIRLTRLPGEDHMASGDLVSPPVSLGLWALWWSAEGERKAGVFCEPSIISLTTFSHCHIKYQLVSRPLLSSFAGNTDTKTSMKGLRCHNSSSYCVTFTWLSKLQLLTVSRLDTDPGFWSSPTLLILSTVTFCLLSHLCCIAKMAPNGAADLPQSRQTKMEQSLSFTHLRLLVYHKAVGEFQLVGEAVNDHRVSILAEKVSITWLSFNVGII